MIRPLLWDEADAELAHSEVRDDRESRRPKAVASTGPGCLVYGCVTCSYVHHRHRGVAPSGVEEV